MLLRSLLLASLTALAADTFVEGDTVVPDAAPSASEPVGTGLVVAVPPEVVEAAERSRHAPLPERIAAVSEALLGRPYVNDPMGEGAAPDPDPFARYDAFDCLTFVEEVLALAMSGDPSHAAEVRSSLRYGDGPRDYVHRRHFMELQWIPGVLADGWLRDTTSEYGETVTLQQQVTAETWAHWRPRARFHHADEELPTGEMRLAVLPLDAALAAVDRIRPGSVILTVREHRPGVPLWTTHVGLTVPGDHPTVRHATKLGSGGTRDHSLEWYLEHLKTYRNWPVLGITILEPVEQGPRRIEQVTASVASPDR